MKAALNQVLVERQGLTEADIERLYELYDLLDEVLCNPERCEDPVALVERIEFDLQQTWRFHPSKSYHKYWYQLKGCSCPKADNRFNFGDARLVSPTCPWHKQPAGTPQ